MNRLAAQLFNHIYTTRSQQTGHLLRRLQHSTLTAVLSLAIVSCYQTESELTSDNKSLTTQASPESTELTIWWDKGFVLEEDEALQQLVDQWEEQTNHTVDLSFYTTDDLPQKVQRALQAGNPPDIMMSHDAERSLNPYLAWQGKLVDVSEVIQPVENLYSTPILEAVNYYNNVSKERNYYAVPISQGTNHIFYWRDLIQQAGYGEADIPRDWDGFWAFWKQVQDNLPDSEGEKIYGLGFSFSDKAGDAYYLFEQIMEAYEVQLLSPDGELMIDDPTVREGLIKALEWYTQFYQQGYVPPQAETWLNPDNNSNLLNRSIVMTPNTGLSIPVTVRADPETYNKLGILEFPNKPNGQPTRHLITVKQAVIFTDSNQQQLAKDFLSYLIQPENIGTYLKTAGGRNLPVMAPVWQDPFWTNPADLHLSTAAKTLTSEYTRPFPTVYHPAYSLIIQENVWGKTIHRIAIDGIPPEQAADEAIDQIKTIFDQWQ